MFAELLKGAREKAEALVAWAVRTRNPRKAARYEKIVKWIDARLARSATNKKETARVL